MVRESGSYNPQARKLYTTWYELELAHEDLDTQITTPGHFIIDAKVAGVHSPVFPQNSIRAKSNI
jgi:hypothetical protein